MNEGKEIIVYADGSSLGNPGRAGFGVVIIFTKKIVELGGYNRHATNNEMELTAAIEALSYLKKKNYEGEKVLICSDSSYVIRGAESWVHLWKKNKWLTSTKNPVENKKLWEKLDTLQSLFSVTWEKVAGHSGIPLNERVDFIARTLASGKKVSLFVGGKEEYGVDVTQKKSTKAKKKSSTKSVGGKNPLGYASIAHGKFMTHMDWESCKKRVMGVSGAKFKKYFSEEEIISLKKEWSK